MKSVYSVLALPATKATSELKSGGKLSLTAGRPQPPYDPRLSDFQLKLKLLESKGLLYEDDKPILSELLAQNNIEKEAREYFDDMGVELTVSKDVLPLLYYLINTGGDWRSALGNLPPVDVVNIMKSPLMNQDLFDIFYEFYTVNNVKVAIEELDEVADEFGFDKPVIIIDDFDTAFLPVILNTPVRDLPNLSKSSNRFANLLRNGLPHEEGPPIYSKCFIGKI